MIRYLLDTSCLVSFVTDRNEKQRERMLLRFQEAGQMQAEIHIVPEYGDAVIASSATGLGLPVMTLGADFGRALKKMGITAMVP